MNIVITGNTKGIGRAFTEMFLKLGDNVVVSSRSKERVDEVVSELRNLYTNQRIVDFVCDVTQEQNVRELAQFANEKLGSIDIWINNAGIREPERVPLTKKEASQIQEVLETNIMGTLFGCKAALDVMIPQKSGHIFNLAGWGSDGRASPLSIGYGASKASIPQLTTTLIAENKGTGIGFHTVWPGMVLTDLILNNVEPQAMKIFNILAERPETVAQTLVPKVRDIKGTGRQIRYLTRKGIIWRFITARKRKNRFFDEQGNPVY